MWSVYIIVSDTLDMIDELTIAILGKSGQSTTFCNMMGLGNRVTYNFEQDCIRFWARSETTLGNMLHVMGPWDKITYGFVRDHITTSGWYDVTCPNLSKDARYGPTWRGSPLLCTSLEKKFDAQVGSPRLLPIISEKLNPLSH